MSNRIVVVPGLSYGPTLFAAQVADLSDDFSVVPVVPASANMADVLAQIEEAGGDDYCLVTHSGATLAGFALAAKPDTGLRRLVSQGSMATFLPPIHAFMGSLQSDLADGKLAECRASLLPQALGTGHPNQTEIADQVAQAQLEVDADIFAQQCGFIAENMDQTAALPQISVPTLVVHARQDGFFDLASAQSIADSIPNAEMTIIEDSGHLAPVEQPSALTTLVRLWCGQD